ncbi:MAG: hypothetical protein ACK8QZ_11570 [Anaerolineales bacterium]
MTPTQQKKIEHLGWAIESRYRNQSCAVNLLGLFMEHEELWKTQTWSRAAQDLLAVSFSLWRAAFLADKTAKRVAVFSHGTEFLEKVIEDNAISYVQDRKSNEWTFNYYTRNARAALETLHQYWPEQVPTYVGKKRTPIERWDYCQEQLDQAVSSFRKKAEDLAVKKKKAAQKQDTRVAAKARRAKSRSITLASRVSSDAA